MEKKVVTVNSYTRKSRDPNEARENARRAVQERWRKYYAKRGIKYGSEK